MDASKAFDKINHFLLFRKLIQRGLPSIIIRLLLYWFSNQTFTVRWMNMLSQSFHVTNGVRQGGVLSPFLYNVFVDDLSNLLTASSMGCFIGRFTNHLFYADDSVLIAPSPAALQKLIDICVSHAVENDITYNNGKTECMCILPKALKDLRVPNVKLKDSNLKWVETKKYLGVLFTSDTKDNKDVQREVCNIYRRGNIMVRKFRNCNVNIKLDLFRSYCSQFYCSALWCNYAKESMNKLKVAYNNTFRALFNIRGYASMSTIFVNVGINPVEVLMRKSMYSLKSRISRCQNDILQVVFSSSFFQYRSMLHCLWKSKLYG